VDFKVIQDIVGTIVKTVEETAVGSVRAVKKHTFDVKVKNLPTTQAVKGTVTVGNQKNVEKELREHKKLLKAIRKFLSGFKLPKSIEVSNFPKPVKPLPFPKEFKVSNFPKQKEYPKNMRVSNQPTKEIKAVEDRVAAVEMAIKALKLDPKINVETPKIPDINVPEPSVTVTQKDIDYERLAKLIPVAEKIDYNKLAEKIGKELANMVVSIGGGGSSGGNSFYGRDGKPGRALVDSEGRVITSPDYFLADKEVGPTTTYTGNENSEGAWYIMMISGDAIRYASNNNNDKKDYAEAWSDRATLNYDYPSKVEF
jgi:hypothetical protein